MEGNNWHSAPSPFQAIDSSGGIGALGAIRTPDPQIRSLMLYPAELRARTAFRRGAEPSRAKLKLQGALSAAVLRASRGAGAALVGLQQVEAALFEVGAHGDPVRAE